MRRLDLMLGPHPSVTGGSRLDAVLALIALFTILLASISLAKALPRAEQQEAKAVSRPRQQTPKNSLQYTVWSFGESPAGAGLDINLPRKGFVESNLLSEKRHIFNGLSEEIIIIGERQRRAFILDKPSEVLTGPRALDAAQPIVPWIGTICSYKTLCYDESQPRLRGTIPKLLQVILGE